MKKIFIILLLTFLPVFVSAEEIVDVKIEPVEKVYWNYYRVGYLYSGQFSYIHVGDKLGYSINVTKELIDEPYKATTETVRSSRVMPHAYFGYGYNGNNTLEHYMATQKLIWRATDSVEVYFTTGPNSTGSIIDISKYEEEVSNLYDNYTYFPDYGKNLIFYIGTRNIITKKNAVPNDFNVINETINNISIDEDKKLIIDANEIGSSYFYLEAKYPKRGDNIVYRGKDNKKVIVAGEVENTKKKYTYEVIGGSININVKFNKISEQNITNNIFELYDLNDKLIGIYSPNKDGNIKISNLQIGKYKLIHTDITEGYNKENNEYLFEINVQNLNINKEIILNLKTTKVSINKTYGNIILNDINSDSNIIYQIYSEKGDCINQVKTNENGYVEFNLDYGNYIISESNLKRNIDYIEINKTMFDSNNHFDIHTYEYKTNLKVITLNKETNEKISNVKFIINDNEYTTNEQGDCIIKNIIFDTYKFNEININGFKKLDSNTYEINENSKFYIENNEPYTEIKLYLEKDEEITKENESIIEKKEEKDEQNNVIVEENNKDKEENKNIIVDVENEQINNKIEENNETIKAEIDISHIKDSIEKLPFLGDKSINEDSKIIDYICKFINFIRM